jgi:uncharacterized protein YfaS (alpha-2-macroglobulin family)
MKLNFDSTGISRWSGLLAFLLYSATSAVAGDATSLAHQRTRAGQAQKSGNYRDALEIYQSLLRESRNGEAQQDLPQAVECLRQLNRISETDELLAETVGRFDSDWRLLEAAAQCYIGLPHWGYRLDGQFLRGPHRGGGQALDSSERDRVRALQLMNQARNCLPEALPAGQQADFYQAFAGIVRYQRDGGQTWRLQELSDPEQLPDTQERQYAWRRSPLGAPVEASGNPVYHQIPPSFEQSRSDGERWRWLLQQARSIDPQRAPAIDSEFARFLWQQFGVQTMRSRPVPYRNDGDADTSNLAALSTLSEDETLAQLATGIRRFTLPPEFNFIRIFRQIADSGTSSEGSQALEMLASIFTNRRQYTTAAGIWERCIRSYGPGKNRHRQKQLEQIIGNWGEFEPDKMKPAGIRSSLSYRFRNAQHVSFSATQIKTDLLLEDIKNYLRAKPARLKHDKLNLHDIGWRLVHQNETKYLGREVAAWTRQLTPRPGHVDTRLDIETPLTRAGAYLVTATLKDGNTSRIILWLADTVIAEKNLDQRKYYFVADALSGAPIPGARLDFFGYRQQYRKGKSYELQISELHKTADSQGQVLPEPQELLARHNWLITASTPEGRLAFLGFQGVWYSRLSDQHYELIKAFAVTDRPVYRPGQTVFFKTWLRRAKYDLDDASAYAGQSVRLTIANPKGEKLLEKDFLCDGYGGLTGDCQLPADAALGVYHLQIPGHQGGISFRVEEYRKPEYEVTVELPEKPVSLGESVQATVRARYYFGSPVTQGTVRLKVTRSSHENRWFAPAPWDWLYGAGYGWFSPDYSWYPHWRNWGCPAPRPWWIPWQRDPPEVVLDHELSIGPDGTVPVSFDTALAKELHGDTDHEYEITAEVVDQSRRTIVGQGKLLLARAPFKVSVWLNRGHFQTGETVTASIDTRRPDGRALACQTTVRLLKLSYDRDRQPRETELQSWQLDTDSEGRAQLKLTAARAGQYRLACTAVDSEGHRIEGGMLFLVRGADSAENRDFRFNHLELIPDKKEYRPGETVNLLINTDQADSTVLLFTRPVNGICQPPQVLHLRGQSMLVPITVSQADMPNFFLEALTIRNGQIHSQLREIIVPPESRVLKMDLLPEEAVSAPGKNVKVRLRLTDLDGAPFVGATVVTMYDRALEYISGGSNVSEIRAFFWKWRRRHSARTLSNLDRTFRNLLRRGELAMRPLGAFGHLDADQESDALALGGARKMMRSGGLMMSKAMPMAAAENMAMADAAPAEQETELIQPTVRQAFADTAFWSADLQTDANGIAEFSVTMPDNLTSWQLRAWAMGHGTRVGQAESEIVTRKNLLLRLQAPRFFVEKDEVSLSAIIHNYTKSRQNVTALLKLAGDTLRANSPLSQKVEIAAGGETRVEWTVTALREGEAVIQMQALTTSESDAMQMRFPVHVHGMQKTEYFSGRLSPSESSGNVAFTVPEQRRVDASELDVRFSPSIASALVDALPYLAEYPYGCTEQTLNRFLPAVITQKILLKLGLNLAEIRQRQAQLQPRKPGDPAARPDNPVFDEGTLQEMVREGLKQLGEMELDDGGWGWFSGWGEQSWPHTTATVVHGLLLTRQNGLAPAPTMLQRGLDWLKAYQERELRKLQNAETQSKPWKAHADELDALVAEVLSEADAPDAAMIDFLYRDRTRLSLYANCLLALTCQRLQDTEKLAMLRRNLEQYLERDPENQTAWLRLSGQSYWWRWYGDELETQACYLKLLTRVEPQSDTAAGLAKYLLNNRKHATYWKSTRDTALCIESLAEFLQASGEDTPELELEIRLDGQLLKKQSINRDNLFSIEQTLRLTGQTLTSGKHTLEFHKQGRGPLYYNVALGYFSLEDHITKAGLEIKIDRRFYRLEKIARQTSTAGSQGQVVQQKTEAYRRVPLNNLDQVVSGDLIEIELGLDSKNDYEYLVIEDFKAAGFEPLQIRSGYGDNALGAYMEMRDNRVAFFVRTLSRGRHNLAYRLRAETPGRFSALPARARAMYAPDLKANSDEIKLRISSAEAF